MLLVRVFVLISEVMLSCNSLLFVVVDVHYEFGVHLWLNFRVRIEPFVRRFFIITSIIFNFRRSRAKSSFNVSHLGSMRLAFSFAGSFFDYR